MKQHRSRPKLTCQGKQAPLLETCESTAPGSVFSEPGKSTISFDGARYTYTGYALEGEQAYLLKTYH